MNLKAPILLFTYKRLDVLKRTVLALQQNYLAEDSMLYIFSDAAKHEKDAEIIKEVRDFIKSIAGFKEVIIFEAVVNKGLATSIIDGVTHVMSIHDKVIVLEDDLRTTPNFLSFMNETLNHFESKKNVFSISGYSFNLGDLQDGNDIYFLNRGWSWGWATWKDRWSTVDWDVSNYSQYQVDKKAQRLFAQGGSDLNAMLNKQMTGKLDSWAIRWFYHQFNIAGITVYPIYSKVYNDGFDEDATHTSGSGRRYLPAMDITHKTEFLFPEYAQLSQNYQSRFLKKMGLRSRVISKFETILKSIFN